MNWSFTFESLPVALLPLALLVVIGLVALLYRGTAKPVDRRWRIFLGGMRWALIAGIIICLFEPAWTRSETLHQKGIFAVVLDTSSSMALSDGGNGATRLDQARGIVEDARPALEKIAESLSVRYYALDTRPHRIAAPGDCSPTGIRTALLDSTAELIGRRHGAPLYGALLISDGADNASNDPAAALEKIQAAGVPIFTASVGQPQGLKDIEVTDFQMPWHVQSGAEIPARISVSAQAADGEMITVELRDGDTFAASTQIPWKSGMTTKTIELRCTPTGSGYRRYTARASSQTAETITDNNQRSRFVKIETSERPRVLYAESHPRLEYKFLRRVLETDGSMRFSSLLYVGQRAIRNGLASREFAAGLPDRVEDYADFRAVILGDFSAQNLAPAQMKALEQFVYGQGGGLLLLGGPLAFATAQKTTPLQDLSPFKLRDDASRLSYRIGGPFNFDVAPGGKSHAALSAFQNTPTGAAALPALRGVNMLPQVKPAAELLASWKSEKDQGPLLAAQRYGAGWVAAFAGDEIWQMQMQLPSADDRHERFVRGLLHWLAGAGRPEVLISVDRDQAAPLEDVEITVQAFDGHQAPIASADVLLEITAPGGDTESLRMQPDLSVPGAYRAHWSGDRAGEHVLRADVKNESMKFDYAQCIVAINPDATELKLAGRDDATLQKIAAAANGKFLAKGSAPDFDDFSTSLPEPQTIQVHKSAWDRPWLLSALLALFCVELVLRRALGLS